MRHRFWRELLTKFSDIAQECLSLEVAELGRKRRLANIYRRFCLPGGLPKPFRGLSGLPTNTFLPLTVLAQLRRLSCAQQTHFACWLQFSMRMRRRPWLLS